MSVARNTIYNIAGSAVPILVSLATVPLYVHVVGLERYGLLSICWLFLGYFGLFDLGLGRAAAQRIGSLAGAPPEERSRVFWTAFLLTLALGLVAMLVLWPAVHFALPLVQTESAGLRQEVAGAAPWLALCVPITLLSGLFNGALTGRERFAFVNVIDASSNLLMSLLPLGLAYWFGPSLPLLVIASLCSRGVMLAFQFFGCRRWVPIRNGGQVDRKLARSLLGYGGWVSVSGAIGPLLAFWDRLAIGAVSGAAAVSIYVIPFSLVWRLTLIPGALSSALFPRFASIEKDDAGRLQDDSIAALSIVMTPVIVFAIMATGPFLRLWLGRDLGHQGAPIAYLLLPGIWINSFAQVAFARLQGQGTPSITAKIHAAEIIPYASLLYASILLFGMKGAAFAWTARVAVDAIAMFWFSNRNLRSLAKLTVPSILVMLAAVSALLLPWYTFSHWLVLALLLIGSLVMSFKMRTAQFDQIVRNALARWLPRISPN